MTIARTSNLNSATPSSFSSTASIIIGLSRSRNPDMIRIDRVLASTHNDINSQDQAFHPDKTIAEVRTTIQSLEQSTDASRAKREEFRDKARDYQESLNPIAIKMTELSTEHAKLESAYQHAKENLNKTKSLFDKLHTPNLSNAERRQIEAELNNSQRNLNVEVDAYYKAYQHYKDNARVLNDALNKLLRTIQTYVPSINSTATPRP